MAPLNDPRSVAKILLSWIGLELVSCSELQTLWAGYGHICAITARAPQSQTTPSPELEGVDPKGDNYRLILKLISPGARRKEMDEGHLRKMLSYEVEQLFYQDVSPKLPDDVAVAKVLASTRDEKAMRGKPHATDLDGVIATLMTDLRPKFPVAGEIRSVLTSTQAYSALDWLAKFHSTSRSMLPSSVSASALSEYLLPPLEEERRRQGAPKPREGSKLWLNGGYTYLATRRKEYDSLSGDGSSEWSDTFCLAFDASSSASTAEVVAEFLTPSGRSFESYIHGDVKSENLFTTDKGDRVAFFDFQYVGLGLGVCDLAKLFTCSVPRDMLTSCEDLNVPEKLAMDEGEAALLRRYRETLLNHVPPSASSPVLRIYEDWDLFVRHWEVALVDWCRFQASWGFWGNTEWLEARTRHILADVGWRDWLRGEVQKSRANPGTQAAGH